MLSREDQRRFEQITRRLRSTDPEFVARVGDRASTRRRRLVAAVVVALWAAVPPLVVVGGWLAATICAVLLAVAGTLTFWLRR
ncbi:DUF3040 domain-containing protein [Polymorphospora rubra]|uniref:DUF3040 domain-containing protein n=1 Tax=Polymorphospora rubra TaxID=338584 RepID=UPI0033DE363B